jgi:hypothetical protein
VNVKLVFDPTAVFTGSVAERRAAVLRGDEERAAERRRELDMQTSPSKAPQERIRLWERLHALRLPLLATHPLVAIIAGDTELTTHDVEAEQLRRRALTEGAPGLP